MAEATEILLTNDDGIDSPGLAAAYDRLSEVGSVTIVAPAQDQSMMGRAMSNEVEVIDHNHGFAVTGTPADCVIVGLQALDLNPDLVVAGINRGANLGGYVLGRSGTVSAAVEAAFCDIPAIATSVYVPTGDLAFHEINVEYQHYSEAAKAAAYLAERGLEDGIFETADYLNVNAPFPSEEPTEMRITQPSQRYEMEATIEEDAVTIYDRIWDRMNDGTLDEPMTTDRGAVMNGAVSVSPLVAPHAAQDGDHLRSLAADYSS